MQKKSLRIVIADDEPITRMDLRELLFEKGYDIVGEASDGFDAIEVCKATNPDLVLMDVKMPLLDGLSATKIIFNEELADSVVLLTAYSELEFIENAKSLGVSGYLVKPIDEKSLIPNIELSVARAREMTKLKHDIEKSNKRLENRSTIERAKGIIMKKDGICEQEAYDYIRKLSQAKNMSMYRISEIVLMQSGETA